MATTAKLVLTAKYADAETRKVTINNLSPAKVSPNLKQNIKDLNNATLRAATYPNFDNSFISNNGADFVRIEKAQFITTDIVMLP